MYCSKHNDNVLYETWYPGPYTLYGCVLTVGAHHYEKVRNNQELAAFLAEANKRYNK